MHPGATTHEALAGVAADREGRSGGGSGRRQNGRLIEVAAAETAEAAAAMDFSSARATVAAAEAAAVEFSSSRAVTVTPEAKALVTVPAAGWGVGSARAAVATAEAAALCRPHGL